MTYIIAGLGNPGEEYALTRHNTGRIALQTLAKVHEIGEFKEDIKTKALVAKGSVGKSKVVLVEPNNYMNRSGASIAPYVGTIPSKKGFPKLIVIYDDLDLGLGTIKISYNKSSGGHNGLESIIKALKTQEFVRIRVGISPVTPSGKIKKPVGAEAVEKHILGEFKKPELDILKKVSKRVVEAIETIIAEDRSVAMGIFNTQ